MKKMRQITIVRKVRMIGADGKEKVYSKEFPVKINAGVPPTHRMCESW